MEQKWPQEIWLVRHGQSAGNVARDLAEAAAGHRIDIADRDVDVPLSELGERQSEALGAWFAALPPHQRPNVVLHSPYVRAAETANILMQRLERDELLCVLSDERLREKEFGVLDRLTTHGIAHHFPDLYEQRQHVGKFYFRPPGGESWCDVILRLRSVMDTLERDFCGERVLIVAHQVTVNCFRYLFEHLNEAQILDFDRAGDVPNCSVTSYEFDPDKGKRGDLAVRLVNFVAPLEATGTPVTVARDVPTSPKA
ncbi:histidine phosphatase family protein [Massilia oculi]|uniref:Histidine phosphatase family protein n=1 Tax=Massilia oculi TaxID=945844 RepID=A0A2S2DEV5_9BURK|nr:histidine phosphatase family protein [Massilia oculi]AWL03874.1 histidine phosphatase family protein [Massilia oculi]